MTRKRRHALEASAAAVVSTVVRRLPRGVVLAIGRGLGRVWAALDRRHVRIAEENLRRALPEWDEARVRATALGVYSHFAAVLLEILWMERRPVEELMALTEVSGLEHMQAALARGRGVVSPIAHLGNWELQGVATAPLIGPSAVIARPLDNAALDRRLVAFRVSTGNTVIYKQKALAQMLKTLREGRVVAVMLDQNVQPGDGIFVRFFGRPACTTTVAAALAIKTGAPIVPAHCVRRRGRPLPHGVRPGGRMDRIGPPRRGHQGAHAADHERDRGLGARDARAVAVAAPPLEDAAIPIPRDPVGEGSRGIFGFASFGSWHPTGMSTPSRALVRAPNWIGDVVLSLPALRDLRRLFGTARLEVLARPWVGELYRAVPEVDAVIESRGLWADAAAVRGRFDLGVLLPNSFASAFPLWKRRDPRALGLRDRRARAAADARVPGARARPGPKPGVLLSGDARRPGARGRGPARRLARVPAGVGCPGQDTARGRGALDRRQRRARTTAPPNAGHRSASPPPPRSWRAASAPESRSWGPPRSVRSARRSRHSSASPRACCAARRPSLGS